MKAAVFSLIVFVSSACLAQNTVKLSYEDGTLKSEYTKQEDGLVAVTNYHQNGIIKETGFFKKEVPDGKWVRYNNEGTKTAELSYANGKRHGEFRMWDTYGNTYVEIHYANGEIITADRYVKEREFAAKDN